VEKLNSAHAKHIGNFMIVAGNRRGSLRKHRIGETDDIHHAALNVVVRIDKTGDKKTPPGVNYLGLLPYDEMIALSDVGNQPVPHSYAHPILDARCVYIDQPSIADDEIGSLVSHGYRNHVQSDFMQHPSLVPVVRRRHLAILL
jgi:hypothetical protein